MWVWVLGEFVLEVKDSGVHTPGVKGECLYVGVCVGGVCVWG